MRKTSIVLFIGIMLLLGQNGIATAQNGVGVNTTNPKSSFEVNGSYGQNITTITTSVTLDATQGIVLCNNGSTAINRYTAYRGRLYGTYLQHKKRSNKYRECNYSWDY